MKIGYARKSTHLQDVAHQVDELTKAGCEQIYQDQTSRSGPICYWRFLHLRCF
ncbi:TPA: recombinase family protein [Klebsiella pneumoniae]